MKIFVKIIAYFLIISGAFMTLGGVIVLADSQDDIIGNVIATLLVGIAPLLGGVLILRKQKGKAVAPSSTPPSTKPPKVQNIVERKTDSKANTKKQAVVKKKKISEAKKIRILDSALGTGELIRIAYHGGSNPGAERVITPVYFNGKRPHLIDCYCTTAQDVRSFYIHKIEILESNVQTDAHVPHIVSV